MHTHIYMHEARNGLRQLFNNCLKGQWLTHIYLLSLKMSNTRQTKRYKIHADSNRTVSRKPKQTIAAEHNMTQTIMLTVIKAESAAIMVVKEEITQSTIPDQYMECQDQVTQH